ncbi:MAG: HAMP domain-containing sensor histidine kinase [Hyphomicrobiales bacterium]
MKATLAADQQSFMDLYDQRRLIGIREGMERRSSVEHDDTFIFMLLNRDGSRLGGNIQHWPEYLTPDTSFQTFKYSDSEDVSHTHIGIGQTLRGGFDLMVARSTVQNDQMIASQIVVAVTVTFGLTIIGAIVGFILSRRILHQINGINSVAAKVEAGFLNERVTLGQQRNEFHELAVNINSMLHKISSNQQRMNTLSENLAHELRTPLNRVKKTVYQLSSQCHLDKEGLQLLVEDIRSNIDATMRTFDAVLEIVTANEAMPDKTRFSPIDLVGITKEILALFEPVGEERDIRFLVDLLPQGRVLGERQLILQMISNVIDNALKFTPEGGQVSVGLNHVGANLKLSVSNQCEPLLENLDEIAFTQFQRGSNAREKTGYGLGLPLVKAIATRHDFDVRISQKCRCFTVEFTCPVI